MEKQILIIDDNKDILYTISEICKFQNWNALLASNYYIAADIIKSNKVDLILVDYHMPEVDGINAVKEIRKTLPITPIIVLTVEERENVMKCFIKAGADDYSLKPIKAVDLISRINVHLKHNEQNKYYNETQKGISKVTLNVIENYLKNIDNFIDIKEIEKSTGIKLKTLYRYLQYMVKENIVELKYLYGEKGRPKTHYKILR